MKVISFLVLAVFILTACAPKSEVDEANKKIAELQAQAAAAQAETEKIKAEAEKLRAEAEAAKNEKPALPVTVSFRKAMMGPGNVAVFNTTIKAPVAVLVQLHSAALGTTKQFELHLESTHATELGHLEGACRFASNIDPCGALNIDPPSVRHSMAQIAGFIPAATSFPC